MPRQDLHRTSRVAARTITAFVDPAISGAADSLREHASQIATVVLPGLWLNDDGIIDHMKAEVLEVARKNQIRTMALLRTAGNDETGAETERLTRLARSRSARALLADRLVQWCQSKQLAGVHLDLQPRDDDWSTIARIADDLGHAFRRADLELDIDLPANLDVGVLATIGDAVAGVTLKAFDEHGPGSSPGPVASDEFVRAALEDAAAVVPAAKLTAGLTIGGCDWQTAEIGAPTSFAQLHEVTANAPQLVHRDVSGNLHAQYVRNGGRHEAWLADSSTLADQVQISAGVHVYSIALWGLGGEDPDVWQVLKGTREAPSRTSDIEDWAAPTSKEPITPRGGSTLSEDHGQNPSGILPDDSDLLERSDHSGKIALTFVGGPASDTTPEILDILKREHVPAAFFVAGPRVLQFPDLVQRAFEEGHEIGNAGFQGASDRLLQLTRLRQQVELTSRIVESLIGQRPLAYQTPSTAEGHGNGHDSIPERADLANAGYRLVTADIRPAYDPLTNPEALALTTIVDAMDGGVIRLEDGGSGVSAVLDALPRIIRESRQRGQRFVPLSELLNTPRDRLTPPARSTTAIGRTLVVPVLAGVLQVSRLLRALRWVPLVLWSAPCFLAIIAAMLAFRRKRSGNAAPRRPSASIVIPTFNQQWAVLRTIDAALRSDVPVDVVVVDDGSVDATADLVSRRYSRSPRVRLIRQSHSGRAAALRTGFRACRTEIVVTLDAEAIIDDDSIRELLGPFQKPSVAGVVGAANPGRVKGLLGQCEQIESLYQEALQRAWSLVGAAVPSHDALTAWRRNVVLQVGGPASDTLAEDAALAIALLRNGWRIECAPMAKFRSEPAKQIQRLLRQRLSASFGRLQGLWRHRPASWNTLTGRFSCFVWPALSFSRVLLPLCGPAAALAALFDWAVVGSRLPLVTLEMFLAREFAALLLAIGVRRTSETRESAQPRRILTWIAWRLCYRPLLWMADLRSVLRIMDGIPPHRNGARRRATLTAYQAVTGRYRRLPSAQVRRQCTGVAGVESL